MNDKMTNALEESKLFESLYPSGYKPYKIKRNDIIIALFILLSVFLIYLKTMAPSVVAGDSGELTTEIYNMGAEHPPGYPLYGILGKLFTFIPAGDVAFRVNVYVGVTSAVAIFMFFLIMLKLLGFNRDDGKLSLKIHVPAAAASFLFAFSSDFWGTASGTGKFYALNVLLVEALLFVMILWYEEMIVFRNEGELHFAQRMTLMLGFMMGLSLTVHMLPVYFSIAYIIVLLPATLFIVVSDRNVEFVTQLKKRIWSLIFLGGTVLIALFMLFHYAINKPYVMPNDVPFLMVAIFIVPGYLTLYTIGVKLARIKDNWVDKFFETGMYAVWLLIFAMTIYLFMMVRAIALAPLPDPKPLSWGDTQTLDILFNQMLRKQYGPGGSDVNNFLGQVIAILKVTVTQFNWINMIPAILGIVYFFIKDRIWGLYTLFALVLSYLMLIKYINFEVDPRTLDIQKQYFLQLHMLVAIYIGFGYQFILDMFNMKFNFGKKEAVKISPDGK